METSKKIIWMRDALKNLKEFPEEVKDGIGYSLYQAQKGFVPRNAKPLKGKAFKSMVMEIVSDFDTNTYRAIYTVKLGEAVYVLHCFQKKSKFGRKTPKKEIALIKQRLCEAIQHSR